MYIPIMKIGWLMLFWDIIPVYTENYTKNVNNNAALLIVKAGVLTVTCGLQRIKLYMYLLYFVKFCNTFPLHGVQIWCQHKMLIMK
jgi:hypothetical protein